MSAEFEDESREAAAARRARRARRWLIEFAAAVAFVAAILGADRFMEADPPSQTFAALCIAAAITVLGVWFLVYLAAYRSFDEFERNIELRALALAGGLTVFIAAGWGLIEAFLRAPDFPLALLAPVFSIIYAIVRTLIAARYR